MLFLELLLIRLSVLTALVNVPSLSCLAIILSSSLSPFLRGTKGEQLLQQASQQRLLSMKPIFSLIPNPRLPTFNHIRCNFFATVGRQTV